VTRVAITTDRFETVAPHFTLCGLDPVPVPSVRLVPGERVTLERARAASADAGLLVITSARTIALLWPESPMPEVPVAAVGDETASAVSAAGGRVVVTGRGGLAGLVESAARHLATADVVFPHGTGSDPVAISTLRSMSRVLEDHVVYRMAPTAPEATAVEAVVFGSPSAVEGWALTREFEGLVVGVIGNSTAGAVSRHRPPDLVAPRPSYPALARALGSHLEVKV
jgi:uroporphyrinogen-III synthase